MAKNNYYEENNKINTQIAVAKNNKTILEFLDRLKFEDNSAQVESSYSRIRMAINDFSGKESVYNWCNLTPEQVRTAYDAVKNIKFVNSTATEQSIVRDLENLYMLMDKNPGTEDDELELVQKLKDKYLKAMEDKKAPVKLLEEKKILSYDTYKNPQNENENLITGCRIIYNPAMSYPITFEISHGYGVAKKSSDGRVTYSGEHDIKTVKKFLSLEEAKSMLRKVVRFCDNMSKIATDKYYDLKVSGYGEEE